MERAMQKVRKLIAVRRLADRAYLTASSAASNSPASNWPTSSQPVTTAPTPSRVRDRSVTSACVPSSSSRRRWPRHAHDQFARSSRIDAPRQGAFPRKSLPSDEVTGAGLLRMTMIPFDLYSGSSAEHCSAHTSWIRRARDRTSGRLSSRCMCNTTSANGVAATCWCAVRTSTPLERVEAPVQQQRVLAPGERLVFWRFWNSGNNGRDYRKPDSLSGLSFDHPFFRMS